MISLSYNQPFRLVIKSNDAASIDFQQKNSPNEISFFSNSPVTITIEPIGTNNPNVSESKVSSQRVNPATCKFQ